MTKNKRVTVVIPVYKDWSTLEGCIASLKKYLDKRHQVFLVNDMGPEWESLENNILEAIKENANFYYFKNNENMGFVKTCNRAAFELDQTDNDIFLLNSDTEVTEGFMEELLEVLYATEKHGIVCPRSNNATILTVPVHNNLGRAVTAQESYFTYLAVKDNLPRFEVLPTGVGFAFLVKRQLIENYGLFDEVYSPGYNEENDFCMRINQYGFNVMMANRSFVFHYESKSFGERKLKFEEEHAKILQMRYPYYTSRIGMYFGYQMNEVDYFADLIGDIYPRKRVLISLYEMPSAYNGTAQHGLLLLENFYKLYKDKYDISVLVNECADNFFGISQHYPKVYYPHTLEGTFHIAYVPSQIIHVEHMHILNRTCLKYAFCMQDIISIRSGYLLVEDWEREIVFRKSIQYCDGLIPFSKFSLEDTKQYYVDIFEEREIYSKIVYLASVEGNEVENKESNTQLEFEEYIAVLGNQYKHKNLGILIPYLKKSKYNFIIVGSAETGKIADNVYGYKSGNLSDDLLQQILRNSKAIIFPSVYEGFGLPILNAINYMKHIIVNNNSLNREQAEVLTHYNKYMYLFDNVNQIEGYLDDIQNQDNILEKPEKMYSRNWENVAIEVETALAELLEAPVDYKVLHQRWRDMKYEERVHRCYLPSPIPQAAESGAQPLSLRGDLKKLIYYHFPRCYKVLRNLKGILR